MEQFSMIQIVALVLFAGSLIGTFFSGLWHRKRVTFGSFSTTVFPALIIFPLAFSLDFLFTHNPIVLTIGLILSLFGSALGVVSFSYLGFTNSDDFWFARFQQKKRTFVTSGPYRFIRHPLFVSLALEYLGLVILFLHPTSLFLWLLLVVFGVITSLAEEKFMATRFPEYHAYAARTGRFFPHVQSILKFLRI